MSYLSPDLFGARRFGRPGSLLFFAGAGLLAYAVYWIETRIGPLRVDSGNGGPSWDTLAIGVGLLLALGCAVLLTQGMMALVLGAPSLEPPLDHDTLRRLIDGNRPVSLCLNCKIKVSVPPCDQCGGSACCIDVDGEEAAAVARAVLGL